MDIGAYELRRDGRAVRIERQPMDLLLLLVERRGQLVSRSEIVNRIWGKDVFVDVETGVHTAIRKIRLALHDSPEAPTCVETVPGKGYRFIASVEVGDVFNGGPELRASAPLTAERPVDAVPFVLGSTVGETRRPLVAPSPEPVAGTISPSRVARDHVRMGVGLVVVMALLLGVGMWMRAPRELTSGTTPLMLAVLPFANLSGDAEREYLAEGLTEETASWLGQIDPDRMGVVARTATLRYRGSTKSATEIGRELGADYLVESSVRIEAGRVRVTATLVRVGDQVQVWSQSYDRELASLLGLQRELSTAIAEQVQLRLSPDRGSILARRQTQSPDAYDLYLRGRNFQNQRTPATNQRAIEYFTRATAVDPNYALAWSAISRVLTGSLVNADADPTEALPRARDAAMRAVAASPDTADAQFAVAYLKWCCDWDWPGAEAGFRRAVALDPRVANGHLSFGHVLSQMGRDAEAQSSTGRARELDPLSPITSALSSQVAFQARDYRSALEHAQQAIVLDPEFWIGHMMQGQALEQLGEYEPALEALTTASRFSDQNSKALSLRAFILAKTGHADDARAVLRTLDTVSKTQYVPPYAMALIQAGLGERESAFASLQRAYDGRDMHLIYLPVDPKWDTYRDDPRFEALIVRCGFRRTASPALSP